MDIHPYLDAVEAGHVWDDLEYKEYSYNEPTKDLPLKVFEAPPPYGKRIVTINIETEGSDIVSVLFAARIYEYRHRFQARELPGGFPGSGDGQEMGKYCRVMKSVDVSEEAEVEKAWVVVLGSSSRLTVFLSARVST